MQAKLFFRPSNKAMQSTHAMAANVVFGVQRLSRSWARKSVEAPAAWEKPEVRSGRANLALEASLQRAQVRRARYASGACRWPAKQRARHLTERPGLYPSVGNDSWRHSSLCPHFARAVCPRILFIVLGNLQTIACIIQVNHVIT